MTTPLITTLIDEQVAELPESQAMPGDRVLMLFKVRPSRPRCTRPNWPVSKIRRPGTAGPASAESGPWATRFGCELLPAGPPLGHLARNQHPKSPAPGQAFTFRPIYS